MEDNYYEALEAAQDALEAAAQSAGCETVEEYKEYVLGVEDRFNQEMDYRAAVLGA